MPLREQHRIPPSSSESLKVAGICDVCGQVYQGHPNRHAMCEAKAVAAPHADYYNGPVEAGMVFEYRKFPTQRFVPDGRRGGRGEFLDAKGTGLSEPNLRGLYQPVASPQAEVPVCKPWCGGRWDSHGEHPLGEYHIDDETRDHCFCSRGCRDAGRPLNPALVGQLVPVGGGK